MIEALRGQPLPAAARNNLQARLPPAGHPPMGLPPRARPASRRARRVGLAAAGMMRSVAGPDETPASRTRVHMPPKQAFSHVIQGDGGGHLAPLSRRAALKPLGRFLKRASRRPRPRPEEQRFRAVDAVWDWSCEPVLSCCGPAAASAAAMFPLAASAPLGQSDGTDESVSPSASCAAAGRLGLRPCVETPGQRERLNVCEEAGPARRCVQRHGWPCLAPESHGPHRQPTGRTGSRADASQECRRR